VEQLMNASLPASQVAEHPTHAGRPGFLQRGNVSIDVNVFEVRVVGEPVLLTYHELKLLLLFFENADRIMPYQFWTIGVWGNFRSRTHRHLHVLVHRLRAKLGRSHPYHIRTVRSRGYGFVKAAGWAATED
jgi:DNA-binding response OmpR family regulator